MVVLFLFAIGVHAYRLEKRFAFPENPPMDHVTPASFGLSDARDIEYGQLREIALRGWYAPSRNTAAVVFVHGVAGDRRSLADEAAILHKEGYGVLLLDLPGHGMSGGSQTWDGPERESVSLAVDWLSKQAGIDQERIGAYGFSVGSQVLSLVAAKDQRIRALVLAATSPSIEARISYFHRHWGAPAALAASLLYLQIGTNPWHPSVRDVIGSIAPRPVLLLAGAEDNLVPAEQTQELFRLAHEPKQLEFFNTGHGQYLAAEPERYRSLLLSFFERNLLPKSGVN